MRLSGFGFQLDTGPTALLDLLECSVGDTFDRFMHIVMLLFPNYWISCAAIHVVLCRPQWIS